MCKYDSMFNSRLVERQSKQPTPDQSKSKQTQKAQILLASAGYDHTVKFWDVNSGLPSMQIAIESPQTQVNKLALTADRKYMGIATHNLVKVYDISNYAVGGVAANSEAQFEGNTGNITALEF